MKHLKRFFVFMLVGLFALTAFACKKTFKVTVDPATAIKAKDTKVNLNKVEKDQQIVLVVTVPDGKEVNEFKVDGVVKTLTNNEFTLKVVKDHKVVVTFKDKAPDPNPNPNPQPGETFKVTLPEGVKAEDSSLDLTKVAKDTQLVLVVTAPAGQKVKSFKVNGEEVALTENKATFKVDKEITVTVEFEEDRLLTLQSKVEALRAAAPEYREKTDSIRSYNGDPAVPEERAKYYAGWKAEYATSNPDKKGYAAVIGFHAGAVDKDLAVRLSNVKASLAQLTEKKEVGEGEEKQKVFVYQLDQFDTPEKVEAEITRLEAVEAERVALLAEIEKAGVVVAPLLKEDQITHYENLEKLIKNSEYLTEVADSTGIDLTAKEEHEMFAPAADKTTFVTAREAAQTALDVKPFETNETELETAVNTFRTAINTFESKIVRGQVVATFDPNFKFPADDNKVLFLTHHVAGDDPEHEKFGDPRKEALKTGIAGIEQKHGCKIEIQEYEGGESGQIAQTGKIVASGKNAAILRIPQYGNFIDSVKRGLLYDSQALYTVDSTDQIKTDANFNDHDKFFFNKWQVKKGQVSVPDPDNAGQFLTKQYGIQRFDGTAYFQPFLYNYTLLKEAGIADTDDPLTLWENGQWTIAKFAEIAGTVANYQKDKENKNNSRQVPIAIHPQNIIMDLLAAQGVNPDSESIKDATAKKLLADYKAWHDAGQVIPLKENQLEGEWWKGGNTNYQDASRAFESGINAFTVCAGWQTEYISKNGRERGYQVRIVPMPQYTVNKDNYISTNVEGDVMAVSKGKNAIQVSAILLKINALWKTNILGITQQQVLEKVPKYKDRKVADLAGLTFEDLEAALFITYRVFNVLDDEALFDREVAVAKYLGNGDTRPNGLLMTTEFNSVAAAAQASVFGGVDYDTELTTRLAKNKEFKDALIAELRR